MTLTIGRINLDDPGAVSFDSDGRCTIDGLLPTSDGTVAEIIREQLEHQARDPWVPCVPVICTADTRLTGFWALDSASVDLGPGAMQLGRFRYRAQLRRVGNGSQVSVTLDRGGRVRVNDHDLTDTDGRPWTAVPFTAWQYSYYPLAPDAAQQTRELADSAGSVSWRWAQAGFDKPVRYTVAPAGWYEGAPVIERKVGETWWPVCGRQSWPAGGDDGIVRISNGLVRVTYDDGADDQTFSVEWWDHTAEAWSTPQAFFVAAGIPEVVQVRATNFGPFEVLANDPAKVQLRMVLHTKDLGPATAVLDVTLRRGARFVQVAGDIDVSATFWLGADGDATSDLEVADGSAVDHVVGIVSDDNGWMIATNAEPATDHTEHTVTPDAPRSQCLFMLTTVFDGETGYWAIGHQLRQWLVGTSEVVKVHGL